MPGHECHVIVRLIIDKWPFKCAIIAHVTVAKIARVKIYLYFFS